MVRPPLKVVVGLSVSFILLQVANLFKVNAIIGSQWAFFSMSNAILPLLGTWCGLPLAITGLIIRGLVRGIIKGTLFTPLIYHFPTICASIYWKAQSEVFKSLIPILCIGLFLIHPIGAQAWWYSCYWLIPLIIQLIRSKSVFLTALGTTFTAHAVGAVLWIYWFPMTVSMFAALMPIVVVERMIYALGMTLTYYFINSFIARSVKISQSVSSIKASVA